MSEVLCKGTIYPWGILIVHAVWPLDMLELDLWCLAWFVSFLYPGTEKIELPKRDKWSSYAGSVELFKPSLSQRELWKSDQIAKVWDKDGNITTWQAPTLGQNLCKVLYIKRPVQGFLMVKK